MKKTTFICSVCKQEKVTPVDCSTGYGINNAGEKVCFACCAIQDIENMKKDGIATLYLTKKDCLTYEVTNWPGTLRIPVTSERTGRHNIAGKRYDVWFYVDGQRWHGVTYGDNTQICHCKKTA